MHEVSLARALLEQVNAIAADHPGSIVEEVRVSVGVLSGIEPALLDGAAKRLFFEHGHLRARLVVESVDLLVRCSGCGESFEVRDLVFRCPSCDGGRVQVLRGDSLVLESVQLCVAEEPEAAA